MLVVLVMKFGNQNELAALLKVLERIKSTDGPSDQGEFYRCVRAQII
jgi:hypothetical protein